MIINLKFMYYVINYVQIMNFDGIIFEILDFYFDSIVYARSVRKVSGLPLYLRATVFERPLRGRKVNIKASRTYQFLADVCRTFISCAAWLCLQSYFWVRRIF